MRTVTMQSGVGGGDDLKVTLVKSGNGDSALYLPEIKAGVYFHGADGDVIPEHYLFGATPASETHHVVYDSNTPVSVTLLKTPVPGIPLLITGESETPLYRVPKLRQVETVTMKDESGYLYGQLTYTQCGAPKLLMVTKADGTEITDLVSVNFYPTMSIMANPVVANVSDGEQLMVAYYTNNTYTVSGDTVEIYRMDSVFVQEEDLRIQYQVVADERRMIPANVHPLTTGALGGFLFLSEEEQTISSARFETGPSGGKLLVELI